MQSKFSTLTIFFYFYILKPLNIRMRKNGRKGRKSDVEFPGYEKEGGSIFGLYK